VGDRSLAISDDGTIVAYDSGSATGDNRVIVRDRAASTTELDVIGANPALSADGCTVALSTTADAGRVVTTTLSAHDLCTSAPTEVVATVTGAATSASALSADGSTIALSAGGSISRHVDSGSGYAPDASFAPTIPTGYIVGPNVDVSADGSVVTFEVLPTGGNAADTEVWVWDDASSSASAIGGAGSRRPTISADGRTVVFESSDLGLFPGVSPAPVTPFVVAHDRDRDASVLVVEDAWRPVQSSGGHHVTYRRVDRLEVAWWGTGEPYDSLSRRSLGRTLLADDDATPDAPLAAISAHGRWIAFDGDDGGSVTDDDGDDAGTHVWTIEERPSGGGSDVDLGSVESGGTLDTTVTITNDSAAGAPLDGEVRVGAPFSVVSTTCSSPPADTAFVLHPGASCTARVRATPTSPGTLSVEVAYGVVGDPAVTLGVGIRATVTTPATTPTSTPPPSSTPVASTVAPQPTLPVGTAPSRPPVFTIPRSSGGFPPSRPGGSSSSSGSSSSGSSSTGDATTTPVAALPSFDPPAFEFAPTIVDAGMRAATITLVNSTPDTISVVDVAIDPVSAAAASFSVEASECIGAQLPGGATCAVDVTFAPVDTGDLASAVLASLADGSLVRAELTGLGAEPPVLTVVPGVASNGQVVSLLGAGFPAGAVVELTWDGGRVAESVEISDVGDLAHTLVVFPHTPRGPSTVTVLGQSQLFGDVSVELLVTNNAARPGTGVLGGVGRPIRP
jgi:hypothetical protein